MIKKEDEYMTEIVLRTIELTKEYRDIKANDKVSITLNKGDIYGFVGVNGAGKTTFMKMICGLVKPTSGKIELLGESERKKIDKNREKIGALIEHPALYTGMTATENLKIQSRYLKIDDEKKISDLLELVGLGNTGKKKVNEFSMGMKQRLGLALALVGDPEIIVLDEPYVGLDPIGVVELRELLLKLNKERKLTIFFSSHNLNEVLQLATRYGFLHEGKIIREMSAEELEEECQNQSESIESYFINMISRYKRR